MPLNPHDRTAKESPVPLDPFLAAKVHLLHGVTTWEGTDDGPDAMVRLTEFLADPAEPGVPDVAIEARVVPGPHGDIEIRLYRPHREPARRALVWLHGGGFTSGDLDMNEAHLVSAELAARADALVVSVGYRLAVNGILYPVPIDDAHAAWLWLAQGDGATLLPPGPLALGGGSAGAALALSTAIRLRDRDERRPDALLLAYPFVHFPTPALDDETAAEMRALPALLRFTTGRIEHMVRSYVGRLSNLPPDALPGAAKLDGLPPTAIVLSEHDDLRPSGDLLAVQLKESGVPVRTYLAAGMLHGHMNRTAGLKEVVRSLEFFASALIG
jgi:acetyl esterase